MSRKFKLNKTSEQKIDSFLNSFLSKKDIDCDIDGIESFSEHFYDIVLNDCKMIKECSEKHIVDFYIETAKKLLSKKDIEIDDDFYETLKQKTRTKLANKYTNNMSFDNNIDIYFNEIKREYILHPQNESDELVFVPENKDIFIKNNLKLVINCAKRYRNLGIPFDDLIQIGNLGLLKAYERFDTSRSKLQISILNDIENQTADKFSRDDVEEIIRKNFKYSKLLDTTLQKIPENGFDSKKQFSDWTKKNIKGASFSSISFFWIRANITYELDHYGKIIKLPKTNSKSTNKQNFNIIRLDSINPHTNDNYYDNQISDIANDEFIIEDEERENMERQDIFKNLVQKILSKLSVQDRRIVMKKYGIDLPFPMSVNEIAESEKLSASRVKYIISNGMKTIMSNISNNDRKIMKEFLA